MHPMTLHSLSLLDKDTLVLYMIENRLPLLFSMYLHGERGSLPFGLCVKDTEGPGRTLLSVGERILPLTSLLRGKDRERKE